MGRCLRGSATTTAPIRRAIQRGPECLRAMAKRDGTTQQTCGGRGVLGRRFDDRPMKRKSPCAKNRAAKREFSASRFCCLPKPTGRN
jgi:hypothetical protein